MLNLFDKCSVARDLPLITYARRGRGAVKSPIHFYCVFHQKKKKVGGGGGVQIACKNAYVINGRPPTYIYEMHSSLLFHVKEMKVESFLLPVT